MFFHNLVTKFLTPFLHKAPGPRFEREFSAPKADVLPLDEPGALCGINTNRRPNSRFTRLSARKSFIYNIIFCSLFQSAGIKKPARLFCAGDETDNAAKM